MSVHLVHTATSRESLDAEFHCSKCGLTKWARVVGTGYGVARSSILFGWNRARNRAATSAIDDARDIAQDALALVPCPRCGARGAVASSRSTTLVWMLLWPVAAACLALVVSGPTAAAAAGGAVLLFGMLVVWARRRQMKRAALSVQFFEGEPPDRPVIGRACVVCDKRIVTDDDGRRCATCGKPVHARKCAKAHKASEHTTTEG
jgi:hypothetical protein